MARRIRPQEVSDLETGVSVPSQSDPSPDRVARLPSGSYGSRSRARRSREHPGPERGFTRRDVHAAGPGSEVPAGAKTLAEMQSRAAGGDGPPAPSSVANGSPARANRRRASAAAGSPRRGQLRRADPPGAKTSRAAERGPAWLVTLLDFMERATARTTSLWQHLAMFFAYSFMIAGIPIIAVAWVVTRLVEIGSWPGMSTVGAVSAVSGFAVIMRRFRRQMDNGDRDARPTVHDEGPEPADGGDGDHQSGGDSRG